MSEKRKRREALPNGAHRAEDVSDIPDGALVMIRKAKPRGEMVTTAEEVTLPPGIYKVRGPNTRGGLRTLEVVPHGGPLTKGQMRQVVWWIPDFRNGDEGPDWYRHLFDPDDDPDPVPEPAPARRVEA